MTKSWEEPNVEKNFSRWRAGPHYCGDDPGGDKREKEKLLLSYKDVAHKERHLTALRKAGLK